MKVKIYLVISFVLFGIAALFLPGINIQQPVLALNNGLALTPPMGWNSWNIFGGNINETQIKQIADALVSTGMRDAGYIYLNLDDNWMANPARDANGNLRCDPTRFPNGMKALGDYIHSRGLKFGIYGDRGTMTCMGIPQSGSHGYEQQDANTYASWGVDYLKYDNCYADADIQADYERMRDALASCGRPIVFSICAWQFQPWMPNTGNLWRTTGDISNNWNSICSILDQNSGLSAYAGPGRWNDPDMLEVGNGGCTDSEYWSHFSLWCMMAAPLIAGNDIRSMSSSIRTILTNTEAIAVNQDPAGIQGTRISSNNGLEIWLKPLGSANGNVKAVALFNRTSKWANITVNWSQIGIPNGPAVVRDLFRHTESSFTNSYTAYIAPHDTYFLKITYSGAMPPAPATTSYEAESGTLSGGAVIASSGYCSGGSKVGYIGGISSNGICVINNVYAATAGTYRMHVYYVSADNRTFYVTVNNGGFVGLPCPGSGNWNTVCSISMDITLNAGNNTIKFDNGAGAYAPDLDRITITPLNPAGVVFYQDVNYGGTASPSINRGDYSTLPGGIPNDWMSSLKIPAGWTVEVYEHGSFAGTKWVFTADTGWVGDACNDKMSSFKIY